MQKPLLYTYRRCPYAMRARMALLVAGVAFDAHEVSLRDKPQAMLARSPKGSVPVMLLPGGEVLKQSWDIMRYALERAAAKHWWAAAQTAENLEWLAHNDGILKHHLDRYKSPERYANAGRISLREQALRPTGLSKRRYARREIGYRCGYPVRYLHGAWSSCPSKSTAHFRNLTDVIGQETRNLLPPRVPIEPLPRPHKQPQPPRSTGNFCQN